MTDDNNAGGLDLLANTEFSDLLSETGPGSLDGPPTPPAQTTEEANAILAATAEKAAADAKAAEEAATLAKANEGKTPEEIAAAETEAKETAAAAEAKKLEDENIEKGLNPDGTKKTTDVDPDKDKSGDGDASIIELVQTDLGYDVEGQFDNTVDGVTSYVKKAIPVAAKEMVNQLFEEYPEARDLIDHLGKGRSLESFMEESKPPSFINLEINDEETNTPVQRQIMELQYGKAGVSEEDANALINSLEEQGKLKTSAEAALGKMKVIYNESIEANKENEALLLKQKTDKANKEWSDIKTLVDSGTVGGMKIPASKQGNFWDYLSKPDVNGQTLRATKNAALTLEQKMMLEYIVFSEFKLGGAKRASQDLASLSDANNKREARLKGAGASTRTGSDDLNDKDSLQSLNGLKFNQLIEVEE